MSLTIEKSLHELSAHQKWVANHKPKLAEYSREQYYKRLQHDPEYRKILSERTKERRRKAKENKPKKEKEPKVQEDKIRKPSGRPRKY